MMTTIWRLVDKIVFLANDFMLELIVIHDKYNKHWHI
jgi:hypothetical protein